MDGRHHRSAHGYPRTARLNNLLREVLADEIRRVGEIDERLALVTVTGVECAPDLRHATVLLASLPDRVGEALEEHRRALQHSLGAQLRLRRTPALAFIEDPALVAAERVEAALRRAHEREASGIAGDELPASEQSDPATAHDPRRRDAGGRPAL